MFPSATSSRAGYDGFVELIEFGRLNDAQRAELEGGDADPFGAAGLRLRWRPKDLHVALRRPEGGLAASAGLVLAEVQVGDAPLMRVVGLGGVIVSAPYRGQGLGNRVISEALRRASTLGPTVIMLFCHPDRAGLYERHGFVEIDPPVMVQQPDRLVEMPAASMWRPLRDGVTLPSGPLTLHGLPF
jgi:predicted N-acetyltransferase YhbS